MGRRIIMAEKKDFYQDYIIEKNKVISYEQTFTIVINELKLINELATKGLPHDIYKVIVEHLIIRISETLQKHIDK
jgi:hypothetical protein